MAAAGAQSASNSTGLAHMTNNTQTQGARLNPDALNAAILALAPTALCIAGAAPRRVPGALPPAWPPSPPAAR